MAEIVLEASKRETLGKGVKRLRREGVVPAIIYGEKEDGTPIELNLKKFVQAVKGHSLENLVVAVHLAGQEENEKTMALIRDVQVDPLKDVVIHVDFQKVSLKKKLRLKVHVEAIGDPVGVTQQGGILEYAIRELDIECLATHIPEVIRVDVTNLNVGQSLHVRDLIAPEGVTITSPKDLTVFSVAMPKMEEETPKEGDVTEPEVIGKKKEEGEGAEAPVPEKGDKKEPEVKDAGKKEAGKKESAKKEGEK